VYGVVRDYEAISYQLTPTFLRDTNARKPLKPASAIHIVVCSSCVSCAVQGYKIRIRSLKMNSITVIEMREGLSAGMFRHISQTALWGLPFTGWS
jgi:hypothetical protein